MQLLQYNDSSSKVVLFYMVSSTDHVTPVTGATVAVEISKNGGAFGNPNAGATIATEISDGWYKWTPAAADLNTYGPFAVKGVATGADQFNAQYLVVAYDPYASTNLGLSYLVNNIVTTSNLPANFSSLGIETDGDLTKVNTLDGHTPQTGDSYAIVSNGTYGNSALLQGIDANGQDITDLDQKVGIIDANVDLVLADTNELQTNQYTTADIADAVWDEVLTGASHNTPTSAGRRLRELSSTIVLSGTAVSAGTNGNQIQLDTDASTSNGAYDPAEIAIVAGTGIGQCRLILQYDGATRTATVDRTWKTTPDDTSQYIIYCSSGREHVNEGLAQAGATTTITLNSDASDEDDAYNGQLLFIRSGTGEDQVRQVTDYVGSTKVATVHRAWDVTPDTTSGYVILPCSTDAEITANLSTAAITAIDTELTDNHGSGSWTTGGTGGGAVTWVDTTTDSVSGNPIDGVRVWATTDEAGSNIVASGHTDSSGEVTFYLDAGTYYFWKELAGYSFTNPQEVEVA